MSSSTPRADAFALLHRQAREALVSMYNIALDTSTTDLLALLVQGKQAHAAYCGNDDIRRYLTSLIGRIDFELASRAATGKDPELIGRETIEASRFWVDAPAIGWPATVQVNRHYLPPDHPALGWIAPARSGLLRDVIAFGEPVKEVVLSQGRAAELPRPRLYYSRQEVVALTSQLAPR
jgi:hypothetical protein